MVIGESLIHLDNIFINPYSPDDFTDCSSIDGTAIPGPASDSDADCSNMGINQHPSFLSVCMQFAVAYPKP